MWYGSLTHSVKNSPTLHACMMADLGTPAAGAMTPNPATSGTGKQPLVYICGGRSEKMEHLCVDLGPVNLRKLS